MKKRFVKILVASLFAVSSLGFSACSLFNCGGEKEKTVKVSNLDELLSAGGKVVLTDDIDCDFMTINGLYCSSFDGQGHTIKNAVLNGSFFPTTHTSPSSSSYKNSQNIKNVTFDNITCRTSSNSNVSIVAGCEYGISMENVRVQNSTLEVGQGTSTLQAGIFVNCVTNRAAGERASFKNCTADNVKVKLGYDSTSTDKVRTDVYFGGLIGYGLDVAIDDCSVTNCDIEIAMACTGAVYAGGLVGWFEELRSDSNSSINRSFVKDSKIGINATYYSQIMGIVTKSTDVYLGGLAGYYSTSGSIIQSYSSDNNFDTGCSGQTKMGGLVGEFKGASVTSCYSSNNYIRAGYCDIGKRAHTVGGFIGVARNCAITSCFAAGNTVRADGTKILHEVTSGKADDLKHNLNDNTYSLIGGFIASVNTVSMTFCAADNTVCDSVHDQYGTICDPRIDTYNLKTGDKADQFSLGGTILNCYISYKSNLTIAGNSLNLEVLDGSVWHTNEIKTKLNLVGANWVISGDDFPTLAFGE